MIRMSVKVKDLLWDATAFRTGEKLQPLIDSIEQHGVLADSVIFVKALCDKWLVVTGRSLSRAAAMLGLRHLQAIRIDDDMDQEILRTKEDHMKRITLAVLQQHDLDHDDCIVRQLEMAVEYCLTSPGYAMQFWKDVRLYGVDEAILYVRNGHHGDADSIATAWEDIRKRL